MIDAEVYRAQVLESAAYLKARLTNPPELVVITGTGQEILPQDLIVLSATSYSDIPNFPGTTVPGHSGTLVEGRLGERNCLFLQGRVHWYEGYDTKTITLPLRVMATLGVKLLIITNTAGGLNPDYLPGDLMVIRDHINFIGDNPLRGPNHEKWGPRFPDLSQAYSPRLMAVAQEAAASHLRQQLRSGVYVAIPGPSLETPAETRFLRSCGADAVGMSTAPEVIVGVHAGMEVLGLSVIANVNNPDCMQPIHMDQVISQVKKAAGSLCRLLSVIINRL